MQLLWPLITIACNCEIMLAMSGASKQFKSKIILVMALAHVVSPLSAYGQTIETKSSNTEEAMQIEAARKATIKKSGPLKIGLALGGGGARGAAEVGVLKVLAKSGIKFDYIVGTSVGAIVGGLYALGMTPESMQKEFETGKIMKQFMTVPLKLRLAVAPIMLIPRLFGSKSYDGLYKGNKFRKYLIGNVAKDQIKIENLKMSFAAIAFNVLDGKPYMIKEGDLGYALQASSAVPALRKPVEIDGKLFVDGGVACNLPVKQCRELGADIVIAVNVDQPFKSDCPDTFRKVGSVSRRLLNWALYDIDQPQVASADIVIHPDTTGISLISTSKKDIKNGIAEGERTAQAQLPEILAKLKELGVNVDESEPTAEVSETSTIKETAKKAAEVMSENDCAPIESNSDPKK